MTVALCMIVRDEAAILERCLASVASSVDAMVIVDTGSTDGTDQIALDYGAHVWHEPWKNFGATRTAALNLARSHADYLLLLDADDELLTILPDPCLPAYDFQVHTEGAVPYNQPRLVSSAIPWRYEGVTHEYLTSDLIPVPSGQVGGALVHHRDGSRWTRKYTEDAALLEAALEQDPENVRNVYYLANTYRDLELYDQALPLYRQRAAMGGWQLEVDAAAEQALRIESGNYVPVGVPSVTNA